MFFGERTQRQGEKDGSAGGAYRHSTPLPNPFLKVIGVLNRAGVIVSGARVTAQHVGRNIVGIIVGSDILFENMPLGFGIPFLIEKTEGHNKAPFT